MRIDLQHFILSFTGYIIDFFFWNHVLNWLSLLLKRFSNWQKLEFSSHPVSLFNLSCVAKILHVGCNNENILNWKSSSMTEFDLRVSRISIFLNRISFFWKRGYILDYFIYCILGDFEWQNFLYIIFFKIQNFH